jgi:hypothetical protein
MPVAEECLNCWPEATFHNWVNLWQSLALKLCRDSSPVFFGLRQAPRDLCLARVKALAFQSWRVAAVLSHCITEKRRQSQPIAAGVRSRAARSRNMKWPLMTLTAFSVNSFGLLPVTSLSQSS